MVRKIQTKFLVINEKPAKKGEPMLAALLRLGQFEVPFTLI